MIAVDRIFASLAEKQNDSDLEEQSGLDDFGTNNFTSYVTPQLERCELEPENPWCGMFGWQQYMEVTYLSIITIFGVLGNLLVISSIIFENKLYKKGNIFIVNLAMADFLVNITKFVLIRKIKIWVPATSSILLFLHFLIVTLRSIRPVLNHSQLELIVKAFYPWTKQRKFM